MRAASARPLTRRQQSVMDRIDRRIPIKVIASELGVSETRINQHIRALKDIYRAENLSELVEVYRASHNLGDQASPTQPLRIPAYSKNQIAPKEREPENSDRNSLQGSGDDDAGIEALAQLELPTEPQVVPRVLDGEYAVLFRLAMIVGIAFGILAAVVLAVTAAMSLSEALDGRASVPVEN